VKRRLGQRGGGLRHISAQATDIPVVSHVRRSKPELRQLATDFRDQRHPLRIVVVKDMWLTGFDVPVLNTLYIDKPMRDHGLRRRSRV
jgi:type I restriction enzyme R subunit